MRILLKELLNVTEQAPQPQQTAPGQAPNQPAKPAAPAAVSAPAPDPALDEPTEDPNTDAPAPSDPGEYDFTRDFRAFEDSKNKAEAAAKKKLLDKMNKTLLGKKIIANASRGYGQPKTDYTIESVKKVSVEFWYKDYVVIATDANDKKYFLTPGINIKIESAGSEPAPGAEPKSQEDPQAQGQQPPAGEEVPNLPQGPETGNGPAGKEGEPAGQPPAAPAQAPAAGAQPPAPEVPAPAPQQPAPPTGVPQPDPLKKKKKLPPVAEWIQTDLNAFLTEFMSDEVKNNGRVNFIPYLKEATKVLAEGVNANKIRCRLVIPQNHMIPLIENRDIKLAAVDSMRQKTYYGQYSKGSVDISKSGRYYLLEYVKEVGWN